MEAVRTTALDHARRVAKQAGFEVSDGGYRSFVAKKLGVSLDVSHEDDRMKVDYERRGGSKVVNERLVNADRFVAKLNEAVFAVLARKEASDRQQIKKQRVYARLAELGLENPQGCDRGIDNLTVYVADTHGEGPGTLVVNARLQPNEYAAAVRFINELREANKAKADANVA